MTRDSAMTQSGHRAGHSTGPVSGRVSGHGGHDRPQTPDTRADTTGDTWPDTWPRPVAMSPDTVADTVGWLDREIETGQGAATVAVPLLGSDTWAALPDDEPAKWAAVFRAARTWLADYAETGQHAWREAREELARFEAYAAERDRFHYAPLRQAARDAAAGIERREREAGRTDLSNRTGPELIAAAYASWGITPPVPEPCHDPRALEVV